MPADEHISASSVDPVDLGRPFLSLVEKLNAFGWYTQRVDGNDIDAVATAFDNARSQTRAQPCMIICDTRMGYGVPFLEQRKKIALSASMHTNGI
jgi:transketolase